MKLPIAEIFEYCMNICPFHEHMFTQVNMNVCSFEALDTCIPTHRGIHSISTTELQDELLSFRQSYFYVSYVFHVGILI